jgi:hypothetical protein
MNTVGLLAGVIAGVLALIAAYGRRRTRELNFRAWQAAARQLGLSFSGPEATRSMSGVLNGVPVRADFKRERGGAGKSSRIEEKTTFSAGGNGLIPATLTLRRDTPLGPLRRIFAGRDHQLGDQGFDELIELSAIDAHGCAALSAAAREPLCELIELGGEVQRGTLIYERIYDGVQESAWLVEMLQFLSRLTQLLTVPHGSLHQRLADNAMRDPDPGVRLQNLRFLTDPSTRTPSALLGSTARALLSDGNDRVRLLAALQLGVEGSPVLSELATDPHVQTELRVEAVRELGARDTVELEPLLATLLGSTPPEVVCTALTIIGTRRLDSFAAAVVDCTANEHEQVRVIAAITLAHVPSNGAEEALIRLLSDSSSDVQCASAEALGAIGSVAAVEPLLPLAKRFGRAKVRQAARGAIGRIQSRLGTAEAGLLSLADDHELAGAVAIADEPAALRVGEVTLVEDTSTTSKDRLRG